MNNPYPASQVIGNGFRIDAGYARVVGISRNCLKLPYPPIDFRYQIEEGDIDELAFSLTETTLGPIGQIRITAEPDAQTRLTIIPPGYPDLADTAEYLDPLLKIHADLAPGVRLCLLSNQLDKAVEHLQPVLLNDRLQKHTEFGRWFFQRLRIFGLRNQVFQRTSGTNQEPFLFPVQATCAQIVLLARRLAKTWEHLNNGNQACLVQDPDTFSELGNLLPDQWPVNVILNKKYSSVKCLIRPIGVRESLLEVHMPDWAENWDQWDILRDELEKAGYLHLAAPAAAETKVPADSPKATDLGKAEWAPENPVYQQILDLWQAGKTGKEIARQTGLTEKTIHNLLAVWRKEFGEGIAPRRR